MQSCSVVFPVIAPFKDLPPPTGPHAVGTRVTTWVDSTRDETFTTETDFRRIVVQVWYPVGEQNNGTPTFYIDSPKLRMPALAKQLRLPVFPINHFGRVKTNSYSNTMGADSSNQYPVILFSHGLSGMRYQNTSLMEELASQGYVVFAADHSYGANITIFPDGDVAEYRVGRRRVLSAEQLEHIDLSQLSILVSDLSFMIDQLSGNRQDPFLEGLSYDPGNIGAIGHSLGGAAVINTIVEDDRIDATFVLDGWYIPIPDSVLLSGVEKPFFHLGQKKWKDPNNYPRMDRLISHSSGPVYTLLIPGTKHTDYTDMPLFTPISFYIGYTGARDPIGLNNLIRKNAISFFDTYLKGTNPKALKTLIDAERGASSYIFLPPAAN
jgi:pimeloyl-ACP methyl ester carboxylesterase